MDEKTMEQTVEDALKGDVFEAKVVASVQAFADGPPPTPAPPPDRGPCAECGVEAIRVCGDCLLVERKRIWICSEPCEKAHVAKCPVPMVKVGSHGQMSIVWVASRCSVPPADNICGGTGILRWKLCPRALLRARAELDSTTSQESAIRRLAEAETELKRLSDNLNERREAHREKLEQRIVQHIQDTGVADPESMIRNANEELRSIDARVVALMEEETELLRRIEAVAAELEGCHRAKGEMQDRIHGANGVRLARNALAVMGNARFEEQTDGLRKAINRALRRAAHERARLGGFPMAATDDQEQADG